MFAEKPSNSITMHLHLVLTEKLFNLNFPRPVKLIQAENCLNGLQKQTMVHGCTALLLNCAHSDGEQMP